MRASPWLCSAATLRWRSARRSRIATRELVDLGVLLALDQHLVGRRQRRIGRASNSAAECVDEDLALEALAHVAELSVSVVVRSHL